MAERAARLHTTRHERGSTLLEVLVAQTLLAIAVAGFTQLLLWALATESQAALREGATALLADANELLQAFAGAPPAAPVNGWQASAASLRPDSFTAGAATLQPVTAPAGQLRSRATVRWGTAPADAATLIAAVPVLPAASAP